MTPYQVLAYAGLLRDYGQEVADKYFRAVNPRPTKREIAELGDRPTRSRVNKDIG